jgi:hypothetical protein
VKHITTAPIIENFLKLDAYTYIQYINKVSALVLYYTDHVSAIATDIFRFSDPHSILYL